MTLLTIALLVAFGAGWVARNRWGLYKIRRHFLAERERHELARRLEDRASNGNGWTTSEPPKH